MLFQQNIESNFVDQMLLTQIIVLQLHIDKFLLKNAFMLFPETGFPKDFYKGPSWCITSPMRKDKTRVSIIPSKKIPAEFFCDGIHDTEFRNIRNSIIPNSVFYRIPHFYGIPYVTEFRIFTEFRIAEFRIYGIPHTYGIP